MSSPHARSASFGAALIVIVALLLPAVGCKGTTKGVEKRSAKLSASDKPKAERSRCNTAGKRVVKLDLNQDKQPDVWKLYRTKVEGGAKVDVLTCKERDLNFDGRKDVWYYYDDDGNIRMEEMDLYFDGRIDLVTYRQGGKMVRQEMDTNHNGKADVFKHYEEEILARIERDTNHDGKIDYWEYYEGGQLDRIGYDDDSDGVVDRWDRAKAK
ncbi:MAG: hypothetical protein CSA24_01975 [Deltaproteobacteria bacterium]|nr:MAG: hypothetical protein CSB49_08195 [Pseudomonadota bacterium]PIE65800.1 MAG: hypothetical protein CSA24_01975 [Deltaproteobacteria bacterium]